MPTTSFDHSVGVYSGAFSAGNGTTDQTVVGRLARVFVGNNSRVDIVAGGTACTASWLCSNANSLFVSVDGGAWVDVTPGTLNAWETVTAFTGLADTTHTVHWRAQGVFDYLDLTTNATFSVTGSSPTCVGDPASAGTQLLTAQTFVDPLNRTQLLNLCQLEEGLAALAQTFYRYVPVGPSFPSLSPDGTWYGAVPNINGQIRWNGAVGEVAIWTYQDSYGAFALIVDGVSQGTVYTANLGYEDWLTLATGLDTTKQHTYGIIPCFWNTASPGAASGQIYAIRTRGGSASPGTRPLPRPIVMVIGDELVYYQCNFQNYNSSTPTDYDYTKMWMFQCFEALGLQPANCGIHSTTWKDFTGNFGTLPSGLGGQYFVGSWSTQHRAAFDVGLLNAPPALILIMAGRYDANGTYQAGGLPAESHSDLQTAVGSTLTALQAVSNAPIAIVGIPPVYNQLRAALAPWRSAQQTAAGTVATYFDPTTIGLDDSSGNPISTYYIDGPTYSQLNGAGATLFANWLRGMLKSTFSLGASAGGFLPVSRGSIQ